MINSVNKIPIYELLSSYSPHYYKIPKYQRAYTWSPHEWEALYDDIGENDSGYFMGSIICISPKNENNFEVIDGQQRITTLCLFLTAIYSHLKESESPQWDNIPKCLVDMIADGDEELAKQYLEQYVHKLGNLTLTGYNASLSNKSFAEKRDHKDKDGHYNGYRNGLSINNDTPSQDSWTVKNINARTKKLVKKLMTDYKLSKN